MLYNVENLTIVQEIRARLDDIKREYFELEKQEEIYERPQYQLNKVGDDVAPKYLYEGAFQSFTIKLEPSLLSVQEREAYYRLYELSVPKWERRKLTCPAATDFINKYPIRQWYYDNLKSGGKINKHYGIIVEEDPHLRIHVTLDPGNNTTFFCGDEQITYTEDLIFGFDDGKDLHWVEHHGDKRRVVLIIDVSKKDFPNTTPWNTSKS